MTRHGQLIALAVVTLGTQGLGAIPTEAQVVQGVVADLQTAAPLVGADVILEDSVGTLVKAVVTDTHGEFRIEASPGGYFLSARLIGHKPAFAPLELFPQATLSVRVNLVRQAVVLEPLVVLGEQLTQGQLEFESRRDLPYAFRFDSDSIARMRYAHQPRDVIDQGVPGGSQARCYYVFLDGRPQEGTGFVNPRPALERGESPVSSYIDEMPLDWMYGIEVYLTYYDLPLRYRDLDPRFDTSCGAIMLWTNVTPQRQGAPQLYTFAGGAVPTGERWVMELGWRPSHTRHWVVSARFRFGRYDPYEFLGEQEAYFELFERDTRPRYFTASVGAQGPVPLVPWKDVLFARLAASGTYYRGQPAAMVQDGAVQRVQAQIPSFFGFGPELGIGARFPSGPVRPWVETRVGAEWVSIVRGFRLTGPTLSAGIEIGIVEP